MLFGDRWRTLISSFGDKTKNTLIYILLLAGVLFFLCGMLFPADKKREEDHTVQYAEATRQDEEARLAAILSEMEGVGEVTVMITYIDDGEEILAQNTRSFAASSEFETVMASGSGENRPYAVGRERAHVQGVLVVADGGDRAAVQEKIKEATAALMGVYPHNVVVTGRRKE